MIVVPGATTVDESPVDALAGRFRSQPTYPPLLLLRIAGTLWILTSSLPHFCREDARRPHLDARTEERRFDCDRCECGRIRDLTRRHLHRLK